MKTFIAGLSLLALSASANAGFDFFDGNNGEWKMGPYGPYYEENTWPEWTPMYWMEEMMDSFDDNNNNYGSMPFTNGNNFRMPFTNGNGFSMPFNGNNGFTMPFNGNNGFTMPFANNGAIPYGYAAPAPMMMPPAQPQMVPAPLPTPVPSAPGPASNKAE